MRHFPDLSWMVFILPFFPLVRSFTTWNALSLLFLFRLSFISLHCSSIHFSLASFVPLLIFGWFPYIYRLIRGCSSPFSIPITLAVSVTALLKLLVSMLVFSSSRMVRGANFPPIIAWNVSAILGYFSFSRSNFILVCFGLTIFFKRKRKFIDMVVMLAIRSAMSIS